MCVVLGVRSPRVYDCTDSSVGAVGKLLPRFARRIREVKSWEVVDMMHAVADPRSRGVAGSLAVSLVIGVWCFSSASHLI